MQRRRPRLHTRLAVRALLVVAVLGVSACVDDEPSTGSSAPPVVLPSVAVPPSRLTPFCQSMIDLADEVENGSVDDPEALVLETYLAIADEVPPEIADDFAAVIDALRAGTTEAASDDAATTVVATSVVTTEVDGTVVTIDVAVEDGFLPESTPAQRVNEYVRFACTDVSNNPGPSATEPGIASTTDG